MSIVSTLVENLKANGQDFEFYPTTPEIIARVIQHYGRSTNTYRDWEGAVLDVGAGHGAFLKAFKVAHPKADLLAIEKSPILMSELVVFAKVVGTDFHAQAFTSKTVKLVFCNPPYSDYATWVTRLIRECPAEDMYLVIPQRWSDNAAIAAAIKFREAKTNVIGTFDFEDAERRARAQVEVLHVRSKLGGDRLFEKFFFERFSHLKEDLKEQERTQREQAQSAEDHRAGLVAREGLIGALVALYDVEMDRLQSNYDKAASLDVSLLSALGLSVSTIVTTLRERLDGLKHRYWSELFLNLSTVTARLTSKNRRAIMDTIGGFKSVDFTKENIYAVLLWVIDHANKYTDAQILAVFDDMLESANIVNYVSNHRVYGKGDWRYTQAPADLSHVSLDFRIVLTGKGGYTRHYGCCGLATSAADLVMDIHTVANLLGIPCVTDDVRLTSSRECYGNGGVWKPGKVQLFKSLDGLDLVEVKAHLNGTVHFRLSQKFSLALNVAVGKLRGWIRDHQQAAEELGSGADVEFARELRITPKQLLLGTPTATET